MKIKKKGGTTTTTMLYHPSPSPSPSPPSSSYKDPHSVLHLLPVAILALATALPVPDREVLAYMLTRSMSMTNPTNKTSRCCKKRPNNNNSSQSQKLPLFECGCFDCYTSYWFRWDSSPNRELIHQVIEAFEDHLVLKEFPKRNRGARKKDRQMGRSDQPEISQKEQTFTLPLREESVAVPVIEEDEAEIVGESLEMEVVAVQLQSPASNHHKGLARKVLPDVLGLWNSRLWSLWGPGI